MPKARADDQRNETDNNNDHDRDPAPGSDGCNQCFHRRCDGLDCRRNSFRRRNSRFVGSYGSLTGNLRRLCAAFAAAAAAFCVAFAVASAVLMAALEVFLRSLYGFLR